MKGSKEIHDDRCLPGRRGATISTKKKKGYHWWGGKIIFLCLEIHAFWEKNEACSTSGGDWPGRLSKEKRKNPCSVRGLISLGKNQALHFKLRREKAPAKKSV